MKPKSLLFIILSLCAVLFLASPISVNLLSTAKNEDSDTLPPLPVDAVEISGIVEAIEGNRILIDSPDGGLLYITVTDSTEIFSGTKTASITDIRIGIELNIAHNGIVLKSYPGQINVVYRIEILEEK